MITVGLYGIQDTTYGSHPNYTHDHSITLMRDGVVLTTIQLERYTGQKHDNRLHLYVSELLEKYLPPHEEVRFISVNSFAGNSFLSSDGNLRIEACEQVSIPNILTPAKVRWFPDGKQQRACEGYIICHEFAHIASLLPFVGQFKPDSLLVHIDGGASDSACSFWYFDGEHTQLLHAGWDDLKDEVNNFNANPLVQAILGLSASQHLSIPGKLMGYAAYGTKQEELMIWLKERQWFLHQTNPCPSSILKQVNSHFHLQLDRFDTHDTFWMNLCACIQHHFEQRLCDTILHYQQQTGAKHLYYAGGAALNIPTNARLEREGRFDGIFIPPCTNDSGLSLGAAAWVEHMEREKLSISSPFLNRFDTPSTSPTLKDMDAILALLVQSKVLGVCNGAAEVGPRALGHRSIIARPDNIALRQYVSETIKQREWYRPIAPVVCQEVAEKAFQEPVTKSHLAPYMLGAYHLNKGWHKDFRGVLHQDGTLRVQVVSSQDPEQEFLHTLLIRLWREHRIAGLINTSFNRQGQPILHRQEEAHSAARQLGLDGVIVHGSLYRT